MDESMLNDESSSSSDNETYHCYISCRNYSSNCNKPEECRQLAKEKKTGRRCPIKRVLDEHNCGDQGKISEAMFRRTNDVKTLKWVRSGLEGDMVRYHEARDYTPGDAIQAHYMEAIEISPRTDVSNREVVADISEEEEWRTEDESRFYRDNDYEAEASEAEVEEYEIEDPYNEVKRFSELTEDEINMVAEKLRKVSLKFQHIIRPKIKGGQEEEDFKEELEKWATSNDLIYLVMPQNAEFIAQQIKGEKVVIEEKS